MTVLVGIITMYCAPGWNLGTSKRCRCKYEIRILASLSPVTEVLQIEVWKMHSIQNTKKIKS